MKQEEIARLFPAHIRQALLKAHFDMNQVYEIRLRVNAPLILIRNKGMFCKSRRLKRNHGICQRLFHVCF